MCKTTNRHIWSLDNVRATTFGWLKKLGETLIFDKDKLSYNTGPLWTYNPLDIDRITDNQENTIVEILSPMLQTSTEFFIKNQLDFTIVNYCLQLVL